MGSSSSGSRSAPRPPLDHRSESEEEESVEEFQQPEQKRLKSQPLSDDDKGDSKESEGSQPACNVPAFEPDLGDRPAAATENQSGATNLNEGVVQNRTRHIYMPDEQIFASFTSKRKYERERRHKKKKKGGKKHKKKER